MIQLGKLLALFSPLKGRVEEKDELDHTFLEFSCHILYHLRIGLRILSRLREHLLVERYLLEQLLNGYVIHREDILSLSALTLLDKASKSFDLLFVNWWIDRV